MKKITKEKIYRHTVRKIKKGILFFKLKKDPKSIVYILGYGRSGTSILINLLEHLFSVDAHGERSKEVMTDFQINNDNLKRHIAKNKFKILALKPILNSCDVNKFITEDSRAKVLWLFRDYNDVVYSALKKFDNRVALSLKDYIINENNVGWISNQIHKEEKEVISNLEYSTYSDEDWMALVWWFVNHTLMRQKCYESSQCVVIEYNDLVENPKNYLYRIKEFIGIKENYNLHRFIENNRVGKGVEINLNSTVKGMCEELLGDLRKVKLT